jgi:CRP-like cAMP-binding protein
MAYAPSGQTLALGSGGPTYNWPAVARLKAALDSDPEVVILPNRSTDAIGEKFDLPSSCPSLPSPSGWEEPAVANDRAEKLEKKAKMAKRAAAKEPVELRLDPAAFFQTVAPGRSISSHHKNEIIFSQGDAADAVFYIKEGKVKIAIVSKQGKEAVVALLGADEFFGEGCLIGKTRRLAAAITMSDCTIMRVGKNEIQRLLQDEPAFSQMFVSHILARKERVEEDLADQTVQLDRKEARKAAVAVG